MGKVSSYRVVSIAFLCFCFGLTGCKGELKPGHYEGIFFKRSSDEVIQEPVKIELSRRNKALHIDIKTKAGESFASASVHKLKEHRLEIHAPFLSSQTIIAQPVKNDQVDKDSNCYASYGSISIEFCFKKDQFLLQAVNDAHIPILQLSANAFTEENPIYLERSATMTLTESVKNSFHKNFDSRIAYEHVIQAKQAALAAYLNLVPHLSMNLIWNADINYITCLATIQNLSPFLLPSYWLEAREASHDIKVKELSLIIMRANLAAMIEELTYGLKRDSSILEDHQIFLRQLQNFKGKLAETDLTFESRTILTEFSNSLIDAIQSDMTSMMKLVRQDRFSISQILGFHSLEAVKDMIIDQEKLPIDQAFELNPIATADSAIDRSFELRQLDELKRIAELKKIENLFIWMDPTGDPKQGLGLNIIPQQKHAKSQIREISIQREQLQTQIHQSVYQLTLDYNEAIGSYRLTHQNVVRNRFELEKVLSDALAHRSIHSGKLKSQAHQYIANKVAQHTSLANFRIARAKKDRYLLAGYYTELLPHAYFSTLETDQSAKKYQY
jgi:hypothetical protein